MKDKILKLQRAIEKYLDIHVKAPVFETVAKDFAAQDRLADLLTILYAAVKSVSENVVPFDKEYLANLPKSELKHRIDVLTNFVQKKHLDEQTVKLLQSSSSKKYLFAYVIRELNWVVISIFSASYISANIIMRSLLELLIGIATRATGSIKERVESISFISSNEKKEIIALWHELCAWSHPYRKWEKEVCPILASYNPVYHEKLCRQSISNLERIVDFMLVISIGKFDINKQKVINALENSHVDRSFLKFFAAS